MTKQHKRVGICGYCGAQGPITRDHVIPRSFFGHPVPNNIPIIPACPPCNNQIKSADDHYMRDILTADMRLASHPVVQVNTEKMLRSAQEGHSTLAKAIPLAQLTEFYSPSGLYMGKAYRIPVDQQRVARFMNTLVRGLYFYHFKRSLPVNEQFVARQWIDPEQISFLINGFLDVHAPYVGIGDGSVSEYRYWLAPDDPLKSFWLLNFYQQSIWTMGTRSPNSLMQPLESQGEIAATG